MPTFVDTLTMCLAGGDMRKLLVRHGALPEEWVRFYSSEIILVGVENIFARTRMRDYEIM
jgi:hypothetical protein